jgi:hypothetical protein
LFGLAVGLWLIELVIAHRAIDRDRSGSASCGPLLGECGRRLRDKLYTDRVCHLVHWPDPSGVPHICGTRPGMSTARTTFTEAGDRSDAAPERHSAEFHFSPDDGDDAPFGWPRYYDSLTLFSPARYSALPGMRFPGDLDRYPTDAWVNLKRGGLVSSTGIELRAIDPTTLTT